MASHQGLLLADSRVCRGREAREGLENAVQGTLFQHVTLLPTTAPNGFPLPSMGPSSAIQKLLGDVLQLSPTEASILLRGETGSGKGFIANLIHKCSPRALRPFVDVVCGVLAETLCESELFGHERGAFTGATEARAGRFELAGDGTLFLDEIGDLTPLMQVKLLRVLQDRKFERVGGTETLLCRARIVAATNRDLKRLVREGRFREDLYYRLKVVSIDVPPLRDRAIDIPGLVLSFLGEFGLQHHGRDSRISPEALDALSDHSWPGNVRDLRNCIEHLVVLDRRGMIDLRDLPEEIRVPVPFGSGKRAGTSHAAEREFLLHALLQSKGNRSRAAELFGKSRRQFYRLLKKHGL